MLERKWNYLLIPGMLAACRAPAPPMKESAVMSSILDVVSAEAPHVGGDNAHAPDGPYLVDVASFSDLDTLPLSPHLQGTKLNIRDSSKSAAIRCQFLRDGCYVRNNGLFVHLDSLEVFNLDAFNATVTYWWTERRRSGSSSLGFVKLHLEFRNLHGRWRLTERKVIDIT